MNPFSEMPEVVVDDELLDRLEVAANAATPGPWRNICDEWNAALDQFRLEHPKRQHWGGNLRGSRGKRSNKQCAVLIVRDVWQGEPICLDPWRGYPDYYDFNKIIAEPYDAMFRGRTTVHHDGKMWQSKGQKEHLNADFIAMANPETIKVLVKALREARAAASEPKP